MNYRKLSLIICLPLVCFCAGAQVKDTIQTISKNNIFHHALKLIKRKNKDTSTISKFNQQELLTTKSETAFKQYEGKIVRNIIINRFKFEKTFTDTSKSINYFGTRILNELHNNTKEWAIRDNLFFKENTPVAAYLLADNERFLRTLDYMQDARIIIQPKTGSPDSVDVYVITKDLFSINGVLNRASTGKFKTTAEDVNLFGAAQSLQATVLVEKDRVPATGTGFSYTKFNVAHSFIDASVGYSTINPDLFDRTTDEHAMYLSLQRNLASQYKHFAGGLTIGDFKTINYYNKPPFDYYDYHYKLFDAWIGYNLGIKKYALNHNHLERHFVSIRYMNTNFVKTPQQAIDELIFRFNDKQAVLGQFTFFKQAFYKTNYLYGFGNTEDVPYGYNVSFTGGWYKQSFLSRMYSGVDANLYSVYSKGDIVQYFLRTGTFYNKGKMEDGALLIGASAFSRAVLLKNFKMRQYARISYTHVFNRTGLEPLRLDNPFGIRYFKADSVLGNNRFSLHSETITFTDFKIFGFKFSPFGFADIAAIKTKDEPGIQDWYYGFGGGIRTRNENLVFKTTELRFVYLPNIPQGLSQFLVRFTINIQFRYNTNYVHAPDIIQLNSDYDNNIF
ncbi:hypothetical protein [Parafilimonas sp.]|uniref:hypothetical protein n=1 Tax=Parafilimonas sp. TaxID=1969739 RepID=UPI0039E590BE